jgi:predicted RNase H-like nuclease (RuvC/YqgF family)
MKKLSVYFILVFAFIYFAGVSAFAQQKMTPEEADANIQSLTADVSKLRTTNSSLDTEIQALKDDLVEKNIEVTRCEDQLYALVDATRDQVEAFRQKLNDAEKKIDELSRLSTLDLVSRKSEIDALEATAKELRNSKISLLPEFYDRVQALPGKIQNLRDALKKDENTYTVETWSKDRD